MQHAAIDNVSASQMLTGNSFPPVLSPSNPFLNIKTLPLNPLGLGFNEFRVCAALLQTVVAAKMVRLCCVWVVAVHCRGREKLPSFEYYFLPRATVSGWWRLALGACGAFIGGLALAHA